MTLQDEMYRKALDTLFTLDVEVTAGVISNDAFRVAVRTIWGILGGVITLPEFQELIEEATTLGDSLPATQDTTVMTDGKRVVVLMREGVKTLLCVANNFSAHADEHEYDTTAIAYADRKTRAMRDKGYEMMMSKYVARKVSEC